MQVGLLVFISPGEPAQLGVALLITLFFLFAHLMLQPFATEDLNRMQAISQASLSMTLFVGLMMIIDGYIQKEADFAASGPWGADGVVDAMQEMNRLIFSLFAVVVNFTTLVLPPLLMAKNLIHSLPDPRDVPALIRAKIADLKVSIHDNVHTIKVALHLVHDTPTPEPKVNDQTTAVAVAAAGVQRMVNPRSLRSTSFSSKSRNSKAAYFADDGMGVEKNCGDQPYPHRKLSEAALQDDVCKDKKYSHSEILAPFPSDVPAPCISNEEFRGEMLHGTRSFDSLTLKKLEDLHPGLLRLTKSTAHIRIQQVVAAGRDFEAESDLLSVQPPSCKLKQMELSQHFHSLHHISTNSGEQAVSPSMPSEMVIHHQGQQDNNKTLSTRRPSHIGKVQFFVASDDLCIVYWYVLLQHVLR